MRYFPLARFAALHAARSLFLLLLFFLSACQRGAQIQRPLPLPQDLSIQVYFNHNQARGADYTEPYRQITRSGDDLEQIIVEAIAGAQSSIDVAVQELRLPKVAQALAERQRAGVRVRVILENNYSQSSRELTALEISQLDPRERDRYSEFLFLVDTNQDGQISSQEINAGDAITILRNAGIPMIDDTADGSKGSGLMHHKFIVIDGITVVTGSANLTTSGVHGDFTNPDSRGNANNILQINSPQLATLFTEEFNLMWGDGSGGKLDSKFGLDKPYRPPQEITIGASKVTVQFSPTSPTQPWDLSSNGLINRFLRRVNNSVDLALFVFSEQKLANTLEDLEQQDISIQTLIDPSFAFQYYSEGLDMLGVALSQDCQYEQDNRPWQTPLTSVGIPGLPIGDKLHHKFAIVDQETVITGSHNWSAAANHKNDETVLAITNPTVTAHYQSEFERLWSQSQLGIPSYLETKIRAEQQKCSTINATSTTLTTGGSLVNLNTANHEELTSLPGIGSTLAKRIIEARQQQPFTSLEDLDRVSGIGSAKLTELRNRVTW